jgi:hypothetical protein
MATRFLHERHQLAAAGLRPPTPHTDAGDAPNEGTRARARSSTAIVRRLPLKVLREVARALRAGDVDAHQ